MAGKDPQNDGIEQAESSPQAPPTQPVQRPSIGEDDEDERTVLSTFVPRPPPARSSN